MVHSLRPRSCSLRPILLESGVVQKLAKRHSFLIFLIFLIYSLADSFPLLPTLFVKSVPLPLSLMSVSHQLCNVQVEAPIV